jgi:hypothetical protein
MLRFIVAWLAVMNRDCMWLRNGCVPKVVCLDSGFEACYHVSAKCSMHTTAESCYESRLSAETGST